MGVFLRHNVNRDSTELTAIVIDDDKDTVSVLSDFLQIKGITEIGRAYGGLGAVEISKKHRQAVVCLDVMMETYDGCDA